MPCVFCQRNVKLTGEHVFSNWTHKYMRQPTMGTYERTIIRSDSIERRSWPGQPSTQEVNATCFDCNNGWINDLEAAKRDLLPMLLGHSVQHNEAAQLRIATWATKTALIAGCKFKPVTPGSFYADLYQRRAPHPGSRVWLAASNERYTTYIDHRPLRIAVGDTTPDAENGYTTLLALGHLCLYVIARDTDRPPIKDFPGDSARTFDPIWPTQGACSWPPRSGLVLDERAMDIFADTVGELRRP